MDQTIIPKDVIRKVEKLAKELESVKKQIQKAIKVPKSQAWFWSKEWQKREKVADKEINEGRVRTFSSASKLVDDLHK